MNTNELEFVVFCIENIATELNLNGADVYKLLTVESSILNDYIVPSYDVLHTQSKEYIVNDIVVLMKERGLFT